MYKERKAKKKLPGWVIFPILAAVVLIGFGASRLFGGVAGSTELQVVEVTRGDVKEIYNTSGTVESEKTKVFYSPVNAPVKTSKAKVGAIVKAGDKLVIFDTTNLERDNQTSILNTQAARYTTEDAKEQNSRAAKSAAEAKKQAASSVSDLKSQIKKKEGEVTGLKKQIASLSNEASQNAKKTSELQKQMQENLNSQSDQKAAKENAELKLANLDMTLPESTQQKEALMKEVEKATNEINSLEQEYRSLEQKLGRIDDTDVVTTAQALAQAEQELEALKTSLSQLHNSGAATAETGLTDAQLKNMKVSENLAELAELTTKELLEKGKDGIKAEFDGIIADVKTTQGSDAQQGGELFTLVSNRDVKVELEVSANDFENLAEGCEAEVKIGRHSYPGTLDSVDKIAVKNEKGNPVIKAQVHITQPDDDICIGVSAKVSMTVAQKKNVLCLPNEVINTASDGDFVYIIQNGTVKKQKVELGIVSASEAEIVTGLKEGDQVVSDTTGNIHEGMKATGKTVEKTDGE